MTLHQAQLICSQLNLGTVSSTPTKVTGGLLHRMWKLQTEQGEFACKQLSKNIDLDQHTRNTYELTERIAEQFKQSGIPAITALSIHGKHLIDVGEDTFLVYPWSNATTLAIGIVNAKHALKIAALLAKIHKLNLQVPELTDPQLHIYQPQTLTYLIDRAETLKMPFAQELKAHQDTLLNITQECKLHLPLKQTTLVVSHGDLDQKNVLWDTNDNPIIIDWEAARKLNPTQEIIDAALNWSGITTNHFDKHLCIAIINEYRQAGGHINSNTIQNALLGILNNWLHWLVHNIEGSLTYGQSAYQETSVEEQKQYAHQINLVLATINTLSAHMPELIKSIQLSLTNK